MRLKRSLINSNRHRSLVKSNQLPQTTQTMTSSYKTQPVGFLGLGIMGNGMAARLVSESVAGTADRPLYVWNRSAEKCDALKAKFPDANIVKVGTAKEVVASCGVTYSMLSTPEGEPGSDMHAKSVNKQTNKQPSV